MGEKDRPFSFEGIKLGIIDGDGFKELPIVENSLFVATDEVNVREMTKVEPIDVERLTAGSWSFNFTPQSRKDKVLYRWFAFGGRKPYGIKYPHKKRKIRVLSKWINRYMHAYNYEK